jgi:hypothetical protein
MKPHRCNTLSVTIYLIVMICSLFANRNECLAKPVPDSSTVFGYHALKINNRFVEPVIFQEEKNRFFKRNHANSKMMYKSEEERMDLVLENIIDRIVLLDFLQNQSGITITDQEIDNYINLYFKPKCKSPENFDFCLHEEGYKNEADLRKEIKLHLLKRSCFVKQAKEAGMHIPPRELDSLYRKHVEENRFVVIRQIIIADLDSVKAQQLATDLYTQCLSGSDFSALAAQYSEDIPTRANGGLYPVSSKAEFDVSAADKIFSAQPGEVLPPMKSGIHYIIVKIERFISTSHPLDEFTDMLLLQRFGESELYKKWIADLKSKTSISIIDPSLKAYRMFRSGKYVEAGSLYKTLFRERHDEFHLKRAIDSYEKAKRLKEVIRLAQNGEKIYPENLTYPLIKAECLYNKGQIKDAIGLLHDVELRARNSLYFTDLLEKTRAKLGIDK